MLLKMYIKIQDNNLILNWVVLLDICLETSLKASFSHEYGNADGSYQYKLCPGIKYLFYVNFLIWILFQIIL